jgi:chemotaxis-related protein WspD
MMQSPANAAMQQKSQPDQCWNRIGVRGDRSCPRLDEAVHCRNCPIFSAAGQQLFERQAPPQYLDEWTRRIAEQDAAAAVESKSAIVFRIAGEWLAFETRDVVEVVEMRPIHRVPHRSNKLLLGLVNIRGELHLCGSLRELLGVEETGERSQGNPPEGAQAPSTSTAKERLLVVERDGNRWVFPVDEVEGVHRIDARAFEDLPHTVAKGAGCFSSAVFPLKDRKIGMLSQERLFQALEKTVR